MTGSNRRHPACKAGALPAELIARIRGFACSRDRLIELATNRTSNYEIGDPWGNRTPVIAVKGRCLNRLTNGPFERWDAGN